MLSLTYKTTSDVLFYQASIPYVLNPCINHVIVVILMHICLHSCEDIGFSLCSFADFTSCNIPILDLVACSADVEGLKTSGWGI